MLCNLTRRSGLSALFLVSACAVLAAVPYAEGFESPTFNAPPIAPGPGWFSYESQMNRVASGTAGIPSRTGGFHAALTPPGAGFSGAFSRLGGYSSIFSGGYVVSADVYVDLADPAVIANTYGWDLSVASSDAAGGHRRDFIFHTASNPLGQVLVGGSNNSSFTRRNDLASINHYTITASGWYRFEHVFRESAGRLAVDLNLRDANNTLLWTETRQDNSDLIPLIGGNRYMWFTFLETDYLAVDNAQVRGLDEGWLPVDLNGTYLAATSESYSVLDPLDANAMASATTHPMGDLGGNGQVKVLVGGVPAAESSFTPFSDGFKPPAPLFNLDMRGKTFFADIDIHDLDAWSSGHEMFQIGIGREATTGGLGTPESYILMFKEGSSFKFLASSSNEMTPSLAGNAYLSAADETKFRVAMTYHPVIARASITVTPLNGANAGTLFSFASQLLNPSYDNITSTSFFAGFVMFGYGEVAKAKLTVSNMRTNAVSNSLYVHADDPYNKSTQPVNFQVGMAGLAQPVGGFQAYLQSNVLAGALNFVTGAYTASPFPAGHFYGAAPDATGRLAGGINVNAPLVTLNSILADLTFNGAHGTRGFVSINPNDGGQLDSQFSNDLGTAFLATRQGSNITMVDDVPPVLGGLTAMQGMDNIFVAPGVQTGPLEISVNAQDAFTGLATHPTMTIDFAPAGAGPEDVSVPAFASTGNVFKGYYTVPATAPNGPATIKLSAVDRAGNIQNVVSPVFNVNTATLALTIQLQGFSALGPVVRGVDIHFGGAGGSNPPVVLSRDVTFNAAGLGTVNFDSSDGLPGASGTYSISVKDPLHTLRTTNVLTSVGNQHTGSVLLRGGNLNLDNKIDISDYVVYAVKYGIPVSPHTPFPHAPTFRHADITGDGVVDTADFTFISTGFGLQFDDPLVGNFGRPDRTIRRRITVRQAIEESGSREAVRLDLDRDGVITIEEIQRYLSRP